jgi:hypothetical protein
MWTTLRLEILDLRFTLTLTILGLTYVLERRAGLTMKDRMRMNALCAAVVSLAFHRPTLTVTRNNFSLTTMANRYSTNPQTLPFVFAVPRLTLQSKPPVHLLH